MRISLSNSSIPGKKHRDYGKTRIITHDYNIDSIGTHVRNKISHSCIFSSWFVKYNVWQSTTP